MEDLESVDFRNIIPQRLRENYNTIRSSDLFLNKNFTKENIQEFENLVNDSQPKNEKELWLRTLFQYIYRQKPAEFYKYMMRTRMFYFIFWTESKCLVKHFHLRNNVYIKWSGEQYLCSIHKNALNSEHNETNITSLQLNTETIDWDVDLNIDQKNIDWSEQ